jgi:hypothetical protein
MIVFEICKPEFSHVALFEQTVLCRAIPISHFFSHVMSTTTDLYLNGFLVYLLEMSLSN